MANKRCEAITGFVPPSYAMTGRSASPGQFCTLLGDSSLTNAHVKLLSFPSACWMLFLWLVIKEASVELKEIEYWRPQLRMIVFLLIEQS